MLIFSKKTTLSILLSTSNHNNQYAPHLRINYSLKYESSFQQIRLALEHLSLH